MKKNKPTNDGRGIWAWDIVKIITVLSILLFFSIFYLNGFNEESNRIVIRLTARMSGIIFCIAFGASAIHAWIKNIFSWWLYMNRKYFGISFAIMHLIHLGFLLILQINFHPVFDLAANISLLSGGLAYLFIVLMLLTSFPFFANMISRKNWKILHTSGGYWIWLIFMISYVKRVRTEIEYLPLIIIFSITILLRIWKLFKK